MSGGMQGRPKQWTKEALVEVLRRLADAEGYVTYKQEGIGGIRDAADREFGSWRAACERAGVKARERGRPRGKSERATCPKCDEDRALRKDGTFFKHARTLKNGTTRVCEQSFKAA